MAEQGGVQRREIEEGEEGGETFSCPCEIWLRNRLMGPIQSLRCKVLGFIHRGK